LEGRIKILEYGAQKDEYSRPGWDPENPWDDDEARKPPRRYWRIGRDTVRGWLEDPGSAPEYVLLAIPSGADTVVRYPWQIDTDEEREYHLNADDDWYASVCLSAGETTATDFGGKKLLEVRNGNEVQVLQNHVHGWRILNVRTTTKQIAR
jgi:hypothetical protein